MKELLFAALMLGSSALFAENRVVGIYNNTSDTIVSVFGSNIARQDWEEDILGNGTIGPGRLRYINFYDGTRSCLFDFKVVFLSGQEVIRSMVDVCSVSYWTITD